MERNYAMPIIDSHHHIWNPAELPMPELPEELHRAYLPNDLAKEIQSAGVDYTICVQAFPQSEEGNRWLFRQANGSPFIAGVVAWADLTHPETIGRDLNELQKEPKFVGIRHIVEAEPNVDWIVQEPVIRSLRELARRDIPYDMLAKPQHLKNVLRVINEVPELRVVIDHIAKPNIAAGGSPGWAEDMAAIARNQQVYCKISGLTTEANWKTWTAEEIEPYVKHIIDIFGWDRIMFGGDWPVCLLAGSYQEVIDLTNYMLREATEDARAKVFGKNAIDFYKIRIGESQKV